jgi:GT2 family glycosyltransferase
MALLKYIGTENTVVRINGERKLIKPNKVFSGPEELKDHPHFELLGLTEKEQKPNKLSANSIKFELKEFYTPFFDLDFIDESGYPLVSICIVTKDGDGVIQRCVDSILKFNTYTNIEILLCDTGTTNPNVLAYYETIKDKVTVYNDTYNFSRNNNLLARNAKGSVLLFMNNDVFFTYDVIPNMISFSLCSNMGCIGHRLVWDAEQTKIQHDGQIIYKEDGTWHGPGHHNYKQDIKTIPSKNAYVEGVTAAFLMIRKSIFNKVNGFDERYKDIFQDVDLNLKVSTLGYKNFCIRSESLIHIDHSTRKEDVIEESKADFKKIYDDWFSKPKYKVPSKKKYSIGICATNKKQLSDLFNSIKSRDEYEIVFINNTNNYFWASEALNKLTDVTEGEFIFWMHQDVTFEAYEPFQILERLHKELGNSFGIIGPAGVQVSQSGQIRGIDFSSWKYAFDYLKTQTLDELCLIGKRSNNLRFGEYLDHFHFYGGDICFEAHKKGLSNYIVKLPMKHHSGGDGNLKKGDGFLKYRQQGKKFIKHIKNTLGDQSISTTTMHYRNGRFHWFLGELLGLTPKTEAFNENEVIEDNVKKYKKL